MKRKGRRIALVAGGLALVVLTLTAWLGWPRLRFWYLFERLGVNAQGFPEYRHRQTGIVFVRLPGGKSWMGSQKDDPNGPNYDPHTLPNETPIHEVTLSPFLIGKCEVTRAEWGAVIGGMQAPPLPITGYLPGDENRLPQEYVSWEDIKTFKGKTGLT